MSSPPKANDKERSSESPSSSKSDEKPSSDDSSKKDDLTASSSSGSKNSKIDIELIQQFFASKLKLFHDDKKTVKKDHQVLKTVDLNGIVEHWKNNGFKKIVTMVGAGISTSAGIPDFRSPSTGLYHNLQKYNLPHPTAIFDIDYFVDNPQPFFMLAKELYPGQFKPTPCHYFVRLLHEKGLLLRHYTQNIDTLERIAGMPAEKLVEAHGTFFTNHCIDCRKEYSMEWVKEEIFADRVPTCGSCNGIVKPDIVFFGEDLPRKFYTLPRKDLAECDLLIIMGTSLEVQPFASLVGQTNEKCVRLLINREKVGHRERFSWFSSGSEALRFDEDGNYRDVALLGDCDDGVYRLAKEFGIEDELKELVQREHRRIDEENNESKEGKEDEEKTPK